MNEKLIRRNLGSTGSDKEQDWHWCYKLQEILTTHIAYLWSLRFFFIINNTFIQQGCNKIIKSDSENIYNVTQDFYFTINAVQKKNQTILSKKHKTQF